MATKARVKRKAKAPAKRAAKKRALKKRVKANLQPAPFNAVEAALAAFAHEVRTPLTGILAISSLLATSDLNERERRWVETIKVGAEHLASLATLYVDAARLGNAGLQVRQDFFDLRILARTAGDSLAGRASAKGLKSRIAIADTIPAFVIGDPVRLRAAFAALLIALAASLVVVSPALNAVRGLSIDILTALSFSISDSGIGLSPSEIKRLFKPFSQANVSIASRFGGAGLGLSSVRLLARAMGGDISAKQRAGGGTVFTLSVTLKRLSSALSAAGDSDAVSPMQPLRILSVEDNPFGRVVLNAILTELGHRAEFIDAGELAPKRVVQGAFDAVLMDMVLPGIDGVEAIRRLRALAPPHGGIAIIGVSGKAEDEQMARAAGADAFLTKPVSPQGLATALLEAKRRTAAGT